MEARGCFIVKTPSDLELEVQGGSTFDTDTPSWTIAYGGCSNMIQILIYYGNGFSSMIQTSKMTFTAKTYRHSTLDNSQTQ